MSLCHELDASKRRVHRSPVSPGPHRVHGQGITRGAMWAYTSKVRADFHDRNGSTIDTSLRHIQFGNVWDSPVRLAVHPRRIEVSTGYSIRAALPSRHIQRRTVPHHNDGAQPNQPQ